MSAAAVLPMDYNAFRAAIAKEVQRVTGTVVVLEEATYQNATRPALPYFSFKITTPGAKFGDDWQVYTGRGDEVRAPGAAADDGELPLLRRAAGDGLQPYVALAGEP
jgi:hypothetical protein